MTPANQVVYLSDLPKSADLVVIGGGIVGAATAFFSARAALRTVVVERRPLLSTLTTAAATGAFRAQFDNAAETALVREGITLFQNFAQVAELPGFDIGMCQQGYLWVTTEQDTARRQRELVQQQHGWGLDDVEILTGDEARSRFSYLAPEVIQARFRSGDGWLDPRRLAAGYAVASHAGFITRTSATGLLTRGDRVIGVETNRGTIFCAAVVVAAGPYSQIVARMAGLELPLRTVRRQRMNMPEVPEVPGGAPMTIDEETGAHWRPTSNGANLLWPSPVEAPTPPQEDVATSEEFAFGLLDPQSPHSVARISPFWRRVWERNTDQWWLRAGQYTYTPDHRPFLGPTPIQGLYVNCGYSGHGIMASAGGSRLVVDTITGKLHPEHNPFKIDRAMVERPLDVL